MGIGPLWMPTGSVRAVLAMAVIISIPAMLFMNIPIPPEYWGFAGTVIALYFGNKNGESKEDASALEEELKILKTSQVNTTDQIIQQNAAMMDTIMKAGLPIAVLPQAKGVIADKIKPE